MLKSVNTIRFVLLLQKIAKNSGINDHQHDRAMSKFKLLVQKLKLNEDELKLLNAYLFSLLGMLAVPDKNEIHIDYIIRLQKRPKNIIGYTRVSWNF